MKLTRRMLVAGVIFIGLPRVAISAPETAVTNYTYPATVSYYYLFANDGGISSKLATASGYLKASDPACAGVTDARACVNLVQSGSSSASALYPSDITNSTELNQAFNAPGNIKVVGQIRYCDGGTGSYAGCTQLGNRNIVVTQGCSAGDLAHEFGHAQNNPENWGCNLYVMYPDAGFASNVLTGAEANLFITPRDNYYNGAPCEIAIPDVTHSYFLPQSGPTSSPSEGATALAWFRRCPNNDGTTNLPNNARLKVVLHDSSDLPIAGVAASSIYMQFNGGIPAQGFAGVGDDSIIANYQYNPAANCPDVREVVADAASDANGVAYITLIGSGGVRNPLRKWGAYAGDVPVFVNGIQLQGRLTSSSWNGTFTALVKSADFQGGRTVTADQGELVNSLDIFAVKGYISTATYDYWADFQQDGIINGLDYNFVWGHRNHDCDSPLVN